MSIIKKISSNLHAIIAVIILIISTSVFFIPILLFGLVKLIPNTRVKVFSTKIIDKFATFWCSLNNTYIDNFSATRFEITGLSKFDIDGWYLVIANHLSSLDIVILQRLFNRKIPVLKFFIKDQLKWVPLLGFAWWAMGCPFMKRYSKEYLAKNPENKGKDLEATKKAMKLFKETPSTIISFVEGTRFTNDKKTKLNSQYVNLLNPKAGGIGFVIDIMNDQLTKLIDVTIAYPSTNTTLWNFLCRRVESIKIHIRELTIPKQFMNSNISEDDKVQKEFRLWLNQQWALKDELISSMTNLSLRG